MLEDLRKYENVKRHEPCPCGSGQTFKKCCMKEYRVLKKNGGGRAILSCFSPLPPLADGVATLFTEFYTELMFFSQKYRNKSDIVFIDDADQNIQDFVTTEREHFYKNSLEIIDAYIENENPNEEEKEILEALKEARFENFYLLSKNRDEAIIMDAEENFYNIKALHSTFTEQFKMKQKYLGIQTALIPYKNCYITDGIYNAFNLTKEIERFFDEIPYKNPVIEYNKRGTMMAIPLVINFTIGAISENFEAMEEFLLKNIPENFTESFAKAFENEFSNSLYMFASFLRSTDLDTELNPENEEDSKFPILISGAPTTNYEMNGSNKNIPYSIIEKYYQQKDLKDSASKSVYENIQKAKQSPQASIMRQSSYYTMLGTFYVEESKIDDLIEFLKICNKREKREEIMFGVDNFFQEQSEELGFDMDALYLGLGDNLDFIYSDIDEYREFIGEDGMKNLDDIRAYTYRK